MVNEIRPFYNVGPGEIIKDSIDAFGWDLVDFHNRSNLSEDLISGLIHNTIPISPITAVILGSVFNTSTAIWLNLSDAYNKRKA
jgi:HTH-type transcriptional regulator/antitoxin HigA